MHHARALALIAIFTTPAGHGTGIFLVPGAMSQDGVTHMFVVVAVGLAMMGGTVFLALDGNGHRAPRTDRLTAVLLILSAALLLAAMAVAAYHLALGGP